MRGASTTFSFPSSRRLIRYLGETDAMVELTELASRYFLNAATQAGSISSFVSEASKEYGICVNLAELNSLSSHLVRSYVVTVYHSAECFLREFRNEHRGLYHREWTGDGEDVDALTVTLRNIAGRQEDAESQVGNDLICRFQYYRLVRNWVLHAKESDVSKPQAKFNDIIPYSPDHQALFGSTPAPNPPDKLTFDDFVFFSRLTKLIAEKICRIAEPAMEHWVQTFSLKTFAHLENNPVRMRNAVAGQLRSEYGMDEATAKTIADEVCGSLAQR